jgi:hypothetical protein
MVPHESCLKFFGRHFASENVTCSKSEHFHIVGENVTSSVVDPIGFNADPDPAF